MLYAILLVFFIKKVNNLLKLLIIKLFNTIKLNVYRNANMNKFLILSILFLILFYLLNFLSFLFNKTTTKTFAI